MMFLLLLSGFLIVGQTKKFLEQEGVSLDAFNRKPDKRSKNIILAKNLPSRTVVEQLRDMFIEFADPSEARAAFTKLAYSKFHNAPLYLEWAPDDTFCKPYEKKDSEIEDQEAEEDVTKSVDNEEA